FKYAVSSNELFGGNFVARDFTGRKSSVSLGGLIGDETDVVASGPDDALSRFGKDIILGENGPSADGATSFEAAVRVRPTAAVARVTPNPITINKGFLASTMPGGASSGVYGNFLHGFDCDGGDTIGCFDIVSGTLNFSTSASNVSGQPNLVFAYGTN